MTRIDHFNESDAPRATLVVPAASAVVTDEYGHLLLAKRTDNNLWTIPGGTMKPGETITESALREVKEETGIDVEVVSLVGIYSNPRTGVAEGGGGVRHKSSVC